MKKPLMPPPVFASISAAACVSHSIVGEKHTTMAKMGAVIEANINKGERIIMNII